MRFLFLTVLLLYNILSYSQTVSTIIGKWKLIELREVIVPAISHAKNQLTNGKLIISLVNENLPKNIKVNTNNFINVVKSGNTGNNKLSVDGNSGCNKFNIDGELSSHIIQFSSFNQIDYLYCEDIVVYENDYFKMFRNEYNSTRFIYKITNNKLYFYLDKKDQNFHNLNVFNFSSSSLKFIDAFFETPIAVFENIN